MTELKTTPITVRFIVKNKTEYFWEKIKSLPPSESYDWIKSLGQKPEALSIQDSCNLNDLVRRFPKILMKVQKRTGYRIISYSFEESRLS